MLSKVGILSTAAGMFAVSLPLTASAQEYPSKPIRLVVPFGAGGAVDVVARALGNELSKQLNQQVVVENRTGAGGNIAASFVAKSDPDGYTLLMGSTGNSVNGSLYTNLNYDPDRDLAPITLVGTVPTLLLAHPAVPANNYSELMALIKSKPDTLNFASGGAGTTEHLAAEMFNARAGTSIRHVPYRGGAPALTDLQAGHVQLLFTNQLNAMPHLESGAVKAIGMASMERSKELPNIPTFHEQGFSDFVVSVWWGVFGPANLPPQVTERLSQAINAAIESPEMLARFKALGATPLGGTVEEFQAFYAQEAAQWKEVVRTANITAD